MIQQESTREEVFTVFISGKPDMAKHCEIKTFARWMLGIGQYGSVICVHILVHRSGQCRISYV